MFSFLLQELKNKLGMEVKESDGEEEEEANTGASFMSRYYLRARTSACQARLGQAYPSSRI